MLVLLSLLASAATGITTGCKTAPAPRPTSPLDPPKVRRQVTLALPLLGKGETFRLETLRGHPVLLFVFTTWSLRAQAEAGEIKKIDALYRARGLRTVALALDKRGEALVQTYVDFLNFRFPVLIADPENLELVAALGITHRVPRTVLFDREGHLEQDHLVGMTDFPKLYRGIERLLRGAPATAPTSQPHHSTSSSPAAGCGCRRAVSRRLLRGGSDPSRPSRREPRHQRSPPARWLVAATQ